MNLLFRALCLAALVTHSSIVAAAVVIQYHHVDRDTPAATSVAPEQFAEHMDYLARNAFKVWPLPRLIDALRQGETLPDRVIAISFDDGYESVYRNAWPVMRSHGFAFTVFVNPGLVGGGHYMSWEQLRQLASEGASIANHTDSHPHLVRRLEGESQQQWEQRIRREMSRAETTLIERMGESPRLLAYPYGEYNRDIKNIAQALGLSAFAQHSGAFGHNVDWQAIPRFAFGGDYGDMPGFIDKVNSLPMPLVDAVVSDARGAPLIDPLLPTDTARPTLGLKLKSRELAQRVQCFASGQGRIPVSVKGDTATTRPAHDLPVGRSRINCTAASAEPGRFYWYSQLFMRRQADGGWYPEP